MNRWWFFLPLCFLGLFEVHAQLPETPASPAEVTNEVATIPDATIRERISGIFSQVNELAQVEVEVRSGVVTLRGAVANDRVRDDAVALARRTAGVVMTLDRMDVTGAVSAQLSPALEKIKSLAQTFVKKLPLIAIALGTIIFFFWVANFVYNRERWFDRLRLSKLAEILVRRMLRIVLVGLGLVLALEILDATAIVGAVLGAAGLAGLAFGFAFKNILENYLAGILLSTRNPFDIGDVIEIKDRSGKVALLTARDTILVTLDGNHLRVPNSVVINSELLNLTRNPRRRFEFLVGVSVNLDLNKARRVGLATLSKNPAVLADPKPLVLVDNLGESTVNLKFLAWMDQTKHDFLKARSESIRMVKEAFDEADIEMPEPLYRVQLRPPPTIHEAHGAEREPAKPSEIKREVEEALPEDLSADDTIDKQIAEERLQSDEQNLLPHPGESPSSR